jgi:large subunit ribosomal protein L17
MRHYKKGRKLGTDASHTRAMKRSLVGALFLNDRIKTVEARAKEVRGDADRVIGWAKRGDVHSRRLAIAYLGDKALVHEIFEKVKQGMFTDRNGGYTRIMKLGNRKGDNAPMVILELVTEPVAAKKAVTKGTAAKATKAAPKKAEPKKAEKAGEETKDAAVESEKASEGETPEAKDTVEAEEATQAAEASAEGDKTEEAVAEPKAEEAQETAADPQAEEAKEDGEAAKEAETK